MFAELGKRQIMRLKRAETEAGPRAWKHGDKPVLVVFRRRGDRDSVQVEGEEPWARVHKALRLCGRVQRSPPATPFRVGTNKAASWSGIKLEQNQDRDRDDVQRLARAGHLNPKVLKERYYNELRPNLPSHEARHDLTRRLWLESYW
jgi:hypothetical protein